MPIDTGARRHGRALSRIGPRPRAEGRTPAARTLQRRSRISTTQQIATDPRLSSAQRIASAPPKPRAKLERAMRHVEHALAHPGGVTGVPKDVAQFAKSLSRGTGGTISPVTGASWAKEEGGHHGSDFNILNIATGLNPSFNARSEFATPKSAGRATANFLKGSAYGASQGIKNILPQAKGKSPSQQLDVIAASGWATDPAYRQKLHAASAGVTAKPGVKPKPKDIKTLTRAGIQAPGKVGAPKPAAQATPQLSARYKKIQNAANRIAGTPYVLGGGHGSIEKHPSTLDCSGAVSYVLHAAGVLNAPLTSGAMGQALKPGPGAVTVYYNDGHTFMKIGNKYWGTSVGDNGSGGLGKHPAPDASYLSQYNVGHVPGFGKDAAAALGVKLAAGGGGGGGSSAAPSGGTTTSITHGVIKTAPGFSSHPIKALTPKQQMAHIESALSGPTTPASAGLGAISRRHGKPVV